METDQNQSEQNNNQTNGSKKNIKKVSILLWNVWNLPNWLTDGYSDKRAEEISPLLNSYDIVILNEAFVNKTKLLSKVVHVDKITLERPWNSLFDSGLMILSKIPLGERNGEYYHSSNHWDWFASKGLLWCRVPLDTNCALNLFATHMQAGNSEGDQHARDNQAIQAAHFVNKHAHPDYPILFAGDLNMGPTLDPSFSTHTCHYSNPQDAKLRHDSYMKLSKKASLCSVFAEECPDDINRFLVRNGSNVVVESSPLTYVKMPFSKDGRSLSDSAAILCELTLSW